MTPVLVIRVGITPTNQLFLLSIIVLRFKLCFQAATTLAKSTLEKFSSAKTTFPEDLHYEADSLFRLFTKPKIMVSFFKYQ
jgi:hypothetical protein